MIYGLRLVTAPTAEPVSLAEARKQVELPRDYTAHDEHLLRLITAARRRAESITGRQIVTATWELILDQLDYACQEIMLPRPPLQSVTSVTYVNTAGVSTVWTSTEYTVSIYREPGVIRPAYGYSFPDARYQPDAVAIRYVAGYGNQFACPEDLKAAMLLLIGHWFGQREEVGSSSMIEVPTAAAALLEQFGYGDEFLKFSVEAY